jgi:citronellol/citronellal dehydrogenase
MAFRGKTIFISGASRGIGLAIACRLARDGANLILAAKTAEPHPKLPGTIFSAAKEVVAAGGQALPIVCDIRDEQQVKSAIEQGVAAFGGIDVCVNNASAIALTDTLATDMKRYDLMLPHLLKSVNPHILNLAPPLDLDPKWFAHHVAYTMAKFGMSMCTLGMAAEFRSRGVAVNSLWPLTAIDTAAVRFALGGDAMAADCRSPEIMADAAYAILAKPARECSGNFFIDEEVLRADGVADFSRYAPSGHDGPLQADFFVPDAVVARSPTRLKLGF